ncbi:hypothetical protein LP52_20400 [Streptomonospora alba]|uniref:Uncharacterized protein n=1 Tax=Streptomonospora alba TaxID=183763 RepID=A0A0C2JE82_9ACTN|nr:hypothetical protein LP52_20400 [Streptomonospora alba]
MALGAALVPAALMMTAAPAAAADDQPCRFFEKRQIEGVYWNLYHCPDWSPRSDGRIPVYNRPYGDSGVAGWMNNTGNAANWYIRQLQCGGYQLGSYSNNWWAMTMADNGEWGWVNETYFRGGGDNEADGGLPYGAGQCT